MCLKNGCFCRRQAVNETLCTPQWPGTWKVKGQRRHLDVSTVGLTGAQSLRWILLQELQRRNTRVSGAVRRCSMLQRRHLFDEVSGVDGQVRRQVEFTLQDLIDGLLPVLSCEWRLWGGATTEGFQVSDVHRVFWFFSCDQLDSLIPSSCRTSGPPDSTSPPLCCDPTWSGSLGPCSRSHIKGKKNIKYNSIDKCVNVYNRVVHDVLLLNCLCSNRFSLSVTTNKNSGKVSRLLVMLPLIAVEQVWQVWFNFLELIWKKSGKGVRATHMYSMVPQKVCVTEPSWMDSLQRPKSVSLMCPTQDGERGFNTSFTSSQSKNNN